MASIKLNKQVIQMQEENQNSEKNEEQIARSRNSTSQIFNSLRGMNITHLPQKFKKILTWMIWIIIILLSLRAIIFETSHNTQEASSVSSTAITKSERIITNLLQFQARINPLLVASNASTNRTFPE